MLNSSYQPISLQKHNKSNTYPVDLTLTRHKLIAFSEFYLWVYDNRGPLKIFLLLSFPLLFPEVTSVILKYGNPLMARLAIAPSISRVPLTFFELATALSSSARAGLFEVQVPSLRVSAVKICHSILTDIMFPLSNMSCPFPDCTLKKIKAY